MDAAELLVLLESLRDQGVPLHKLEIAAEDSDWIHYHSGFDTAKVEMSDGNYTYLMFTKN